MSASTPFNWSSASRTHVGKVREINEDAYLECTARGLWVVADGMGGHAVGDVASCMVIDGLDNVPEPTSLKTYIDAVSDRLLSTNRKLREEATRRQVTVIGSTVVALLAFERRCACLWAGDSRIYLSRSGQLQQLTRDHSQVEELIAQGLLDRSRAEVHPASNTITRAIGASDHLELDTNVLELKDGDLFLLCSDGLTNEVNDNEIATEMVRGNCQQTVDNLLNCALNRGARDNVTIVALRADDSLQAAKTVVNPLTLQDIDPR